MVRAELGPKRVNWHGMSREKVSINTMQQKLSPFFLFWGDPEQIYKSSFKAKNFLGMFILILLVPISRDYCKLKLKRDFKAER